VAVLMLFLPLTGVLAADNGDVTDVREIDRLRPDSTYKLIWEPHLAKWTDKHLVCCYGLQLQSKTDMGDIVCSISRDGGKTWSPRTMVFDHRLRNGTVQYAYNNSVLFRPPGQDVIWLFCMRSPMHYRDSENADLVAAYTVDGGLSWQHVELSLGYQGPLIIVAGIETVFLTTCCPRTAIPDGVIGTATDASLCSRAIVWSIGKWPTTSITPIAIQSFCMKEKSHPRMKETV